MGFTVHVVCVRVGGKPQCSFVRGIARLRAFVFGNMVILTHKTVGFVTRPCSCDIMFLTFNFNVGCVRIPRHCNASNFVVGHVRFGRRDVYRVFGHGHCQRVRFVGHTFGEYAPSGGFIYGHFAPTMILRTVARMSTVCFQPSNHPTIYRDTRSTVPRNGLVVVVHLMIYR